MPSIASPDQAASEVPVDQLYATKARGPDWADIDVPDGWQQGRGAFGGMVVALLVRAIEGFVPHADRRIRSLTCELCGPTQPGPARIALEMLRDGTGVSTVAARLVQRIGDQQEVQAHAVAVVGKDRASDADRREAQPPQQAHWSQAPIVPVQPPLGPVFARHFVFRSTGPMPFGGGAERTAQGWIQPRNPPKTADAAWLGLCMDAFWPVVFATATQPRPMATIAFTMQWLADPSQLDPSIPLQYRAHALDTANGYCVEFRELWTADGQLVALNQQTIAVIK